MSEEFDTILIACIQSKSYQSPREGYKDGTTWIRLADSSVTLRATGDIAVQLPVDGSWAAFRVQPSRAGSFPLLQAWGWVKELSNLYNGSPKIDIDWVKSFSRNGGNVTGGIQPPGVGVTK